MALKSLSLSLQFGPIADAALHRAALPRRFVARCIRRALAADAEITVRVVDPAEARALNRGYRGHDHATNVLTFAYAAEPSVAADLVLCAQVVAAEAAAQRRSLRDHYAHLLVHGTLHAQGWDHEADNLQAAAMEARETAILALLGVADPYAG